MTYDPRMESTTFSDGLTVLDETYLRKLIRDELVTLGLLTPERRDQEDGIVYWSDRA